MDLVINDEIGEVISVVGTLAGLAGVAVAYCLSMPDSVLLLMGTLCLFMAYTAASKRKWLPAVALMAAFMVSWGTLACKVL